MQSLENVSFQLLSLLKMFNFKVEVGKEWSSNFKGPKLLLVLGGKKCLQSRPKLCKITGCRQLYCRSNVQHFRGRKITETSNWGYRKKLRSKKLLSKKVVYQKNTHILLWESAFLKKLKTLLGQSPYCTVWKFKDLPFLQIFREINFLK